MRGLGFSAFGFCSFSSCGARGVRRLFGVSTRVWGLGLGAHGFAGLEGHVGQDLPGRL